MLSLHDQRATRRERAMALRCQGAPFPPAGILLGVRWSVAYPLRTRHVEARMEERGGHVAPSTIPRWGSHESPPRAAALQRRKRPGWGSWRMDETYVKGQGAGRYGSRAGDQHGQTMDLLLTEHRDTAAARRWLQQARRRHGLPALMSSDGRDATDAARQRDNAAPGTASAIRQGKDCNKSVEQAHRGVKRVTRSRLGGKAFEAAPDTRVGLALRHRLKQRQRRGEAGAAGLTAAAFFSALAASSPPQTGATVPAGPPEPNLPQNL